MCGAVVWAKVRADPWWPAVVIGPSLTLNNKGWVRKKGTKKIKQIRCVFLQARETFAWLDLDSKYVRPFKEEDTKDGRRAKYMTKLPRYIDSHSVAIRLGLKILSDPKNPQKYLMDWREWTVEWRDRQQKLSGLCYLQIPSGESEQ